MNQLEAKAPPAPTPTIVLASPPKKHTKLKVFAFIVVGLVIIGVINSHKNKNSGSNSSGNAAAGVASVPIIGRVNGAFQDSTFCLGCGSLVKYIHVDRVWCGWQGDQVIIHARFHNSSVEHVSVDWHPSYTISGGGSHGDGLTSIQSFGLDAGASTGVFVKQSPKGVPSGSAIGSCDPAFSNVSSG